MSSLRERVKHEIREILPPMIFFFVAFQLIAFTRFLFLEEYGLTVPGFVAAAVGALIMAKVIPIADLMPFLNRFAGRPLMWNVLWKAAIYALGAVLVRYAEHLVHFLRRHDGLAEAHRHMLEEVVWPHFWAVQIWLAALLLVYCSMRELSLALGAGRLRQMFFGAHGDKA
jgi:hypothetical protein